jgi:hypothetical protein
MCVCLYVRMYDHVYYIRMKHVYVCIYVHACMYVCMYVHACMCMYVLRMYVCMYVRITHVCTYVYVALRICITYICSICVCVRLPTCIITWLNIDKIVFSL